MTQTKTTPNTTTPSSIANRTNHPDTKNLNIPNLYAPKSRGARSSVHRVKVIVGKTAEKQQYRSCLRCKESDNSVRILTERVCKIEKLVNDLANLSKRNYSLTARNTTWKFGDIDLSTCSLEELQKLIVTTNDYLLPAKRKVSIPNISGLSVSHQTAPIVVITSETPIFHAEPMEDTKLFQDTLEKSTPKLNHENLLSNDRKDSGFYDSKKSQTTNNFNS